MQMNNSLPDRVRFALRFCAALTILTGAATLSLHAQQTRNGSATTETAKAELTLPLFTPATSVPTENLNYSSSVGAAETTEAVNFMPAATEESAQPPARRRYGRPRYNDRTHNADGSNKIAIIAGGGLTIPVGTTTTTNLATSYKFQVGVGRNFSNKFALLAQFDYDHFGLPGSLIKSQIAVYNNAGFIQQNQDGSTSAVDFSQLGGATHIWSFTLNPTVSLHQSDALGVYAVAGGGFYHKVTNFTLPQVGVGYSYYYGPYQYVVNQSFDQYISNSAGVNGGLGLTYKFSKFANERLYAEARVVHTFNAARPVTAGNTNTNFFPGNSNTSTYIPITVGIRF